MYTVYIIYSEKLDRYYVGHTSDMEKRMIEHCGGISTYTSNASDWQLRYTESFETRALARKREIEIKRKKSRKYIEQLIGRGRD